MGVVTLRTLHYLYTYKCMVEFLERLKIEHHVSSVVRGHHVSKSFWTSAIDEILTAITEDMQCTHDRFAVALFTPGVGVIGHVSILFAPRRDAYLQSIWEKTT